MHGLIGVLRIYLKHAAILLAVGALLQFASAQAPGQAGAQRAAPLQVSQDTLKRPRITGIGHVRLYVKDVDKSREFYKSILGLPEGGGCVGHTAACFTIFWGRRQAIELEPARSSEVKNWVAEIAFATDDAVQMRRYLAAHGVKCGSIEQKYASAHFRVADPEGNVIGFVQRNSSSIDDLPPQPPNEVGTRLLHAGFVAKDVAAENKFYVDLLDFKLYWYGGMKDDGVDWYELQVPDGSDWIEYMLNVPASADHKQLGAQNHFSFGVNEIQAAAEQLRKNGMEKIAGPGIGRDGKRGLNVYDPDDTRVEVTEFTPAQKPCCHPYTAPHPAP
jgi:catechol 2,3-dioxygenase-like lactoylglutathione lyase family enzyme